MSSVANHVSQIATNLENLEVQTMPIRQSNHNKREGTILQLVPLSDTLTTTEGTILQLVPRAQWKITFNDQGRIF